MCCDFKFQTSFWNSPSKSGDIALITKKKPQGLGGAFRELMSEAGIPPTAELLVFYHFSSAVFSPLQTHTPFNSTKPMPERLPLLTSSLF